MYNFTPRAQQVLALARKEADRFNHNFVGTEHLLLGLLKLGQGVAVNVLQKMGLDLDSVRLEVEKQVGTGPDQKQIGNIPYTPRVKKVLAHASKEAKALNHTYVGTEHILLGLLCEGEGVAARVLKSFDVDIEQTRREILKELDPNLTQTGAEERLASASAAAVKPASATTTVHPMKLGIINSAFQQVGMDTVTGLEHIKRIGFDTVDIFTEAMGIAPEEVTRVAQTCERLGLPVVSLPVVSVGLVDFNDPVREFHIERTKKFIDLAKTWGAKNVLLVLGEYIWQREVIPAKLQWYWGIETCHRLGDYADKQGVDIALELEPFRLSLLNNVDSMVRFVDECNHPRVRANIDISHLVLSDTSPRDVAKLKGRAIHVHLSDCDGKVHGDLPPGRGVVKFAPYLQAIKELEMRDAVVSIELEYSPEPERIVEWVEEAYRETAKLMTLAGLRG
jgi:D-psicose/D-tagatose/L-ribulose 3-epimerase